MTQTGKLAAIAVISALTVLTLTAPSFGKKAQGVIKPPVTSKHFKLGPDEDGAMVVNEWWCLGGEYHMDRPKLSLDSGAMKYALADLNDKTIDSGSRKITLAVVKAQSEMYLRDHTKAAQAFWSAEQPGGVMLKPGGRVTWKECYTLDQLKAAKTEALRWAKWVEKNLK